jgi:hypothetical protein
MTTGAFLAYPKLGGSLAAPITRHLPRWQSWNIQGADKGM